MRKSLQRILLKVYVELLKTLASVTSLNQHQFDALVSFEYNTGNLNKSQLLKDVKKGNASNETILADFLSWTRQGDSHLTGLYRRRYDEHEIFSEGEYGRNKGRKAPNGYK